MKLVKLAILAAVICIVFALMGKGCDMITGGEHHGDEACGVGSGKSPNIKSPNIEKIDNDVLSEVDKNDDGNDVSASGVTDYAALNAEAARYMELIRKADMTFAQVDEIKKWIDENSQHKRKIKNYGKIAAAINDFGKCRDVLMKININADIDALCLQIKNVVSTVSKDNLLRELRIKMYRFLVEEGKLLRNDEQIMEKIYIFSRMHPNGISSFKELEDLKDIRVLK